MFSPVIFEHLQAKLDEDSQVRDELRNIVQVMERQGKIIFRFEALTIYSIYSDKFTTSILARAHSIPQADREP